MKMYTASLQHFQHKFRCVLLNVKRCKSHFEVQNIKNVSNLTTTMSYVVKQDALIPILFELKIKKHKKCLRHIMYYTYCINYVLTLKRYLLRTKLNENIFIAILI